MALSIDPATKVISVPQADLTFVSGALYTLDSDQFRRDVMALLASENYIWMDDAFSHNTEVTVAGVTYARFIEFINGYSITFENTGAAYSVRIEGSNNNIFDVENGILNPTPLVTVISTNSAGLQTVVSGSGVTQQDKDDIENQIFSRVVESTFTFEQVLRLLGAIAAGDITQQGDGSYVIKGLDDTTSRILGELATNNGRAITGTCSHPSSWLRSCGLLGY
jgi:hypothetical protein